jgi:hypothetical protein
MAGHFVLWRISTKDRDELRWNYAGVEWSGMAHAVGGVNGAGGAFQGWTPQTREALAKVRDGRGGLANRNDLPPHRYIAFPPGAPTREQVDYLRGCYWINDLVRPSDAGFGVSALAPAAQAHWSNGKRLEALVSQITHGGTSIEVYYIGKKEMV